MNGVYSRLLCAGVILLPAAFCCVCRAEESKAYVPLRIETPPVLDGHFTEPCWKKAEKVTGFVRTGGRGPFEQSSAVICCDENNLYFAIECSESHMDEVVATFTEHDDGIWTDDCVEIFIAPDYLDRRTYYHFIANSTGTRFEQKCGTYGSDPGWDAPWRAKTAKTDVGWTVEAEIPLSCLGIASLEEEGLIGMSICRERWAAGASEEYTAWPLGGSFHNPEGHVLARDYRTYLLEKVKPFWREHTQEVRRLLSKYPEVAQEFGHTLHEIITAVQTEWARLTAKESVGTDEFNSFLKRENEALQRIRELESEIAFAAFLSRLKYVFG